MIKLYTLTAALMMTVTPAFAKPGCNAACLIAKLPNSDIRQAINEVNNEDQRVVDGNFNAATGTLTLYTQDMVTGADGDISRRAVVVKGFEALQGEAGKDGAPGKDANTAAIYAGFAAVKDGFSRVRGQLRADRAMGSLQTRTPIAGQWTGSFGLSGEGPRVDSIAGGVRYGLSDRSDLYVVVGRSFSGETSWGAGATFILGGN